VVTDPGAGPDQAPVLRYVGRRDQRVKVHGYRIELGDIEAAAAALPEVTNVVVLAEPARGGDHDLVMYVAAAGAASLTPADVRDRLGQTLPGYMVPPRVHVLDRFPLLANGKIDRAGLLAGTSRRATPPPAAAPADRLARRVTEEWCAVLASATGAAEENFFAAGGDSLAAMRLATRLQVVLDEAGGAGSPAADAGDAAVSVHTVIGHPVLRDLVEAVRVACGPDPAGGTAPDADWDEGTL
jgi:hypothetical protein